MLLRRLALLLPLLAVAACAGGPPYGGPSYSDAELRGLRYRAVLVAGDPSLEVWDRAVEAMESGLTAAGAVAPGGVQRLSARPDRVAAGARPATHAAVLAAIRTMRPRAGEGCLVFLTMHGAQERGLHLAASRRFLTPEELDAALAEGCGDRPSFVVASGCYSGRFVEGAMARGNRVVLAAAQPDRPSFGCSPRFEMTVFDRCVIEALAAAPADAATLARGARACVEAAEARLGVGAPSNPQSHVGAAVPGLVPRFAPARRG